MTAYTFRPLPAQVVQGIGAVAQLPRVLDELDIQRVLLITGRTLAERTGVVARLESLLGNRLAGVFGGMSQHTPSHQVLQAAEEARRLSVDGLIALGGGSPIDGTKAVAYVLARDITDREQLLTRTPPPRTRSAPMIVDLPTTLSAAECSSQAGFTDEDARLKTGVAGREMAAAAVIYDPELTVHTPAWLWAATGMRAIDHAVECIYAPDHQPLVDLLAQQGLRLLFAHLPTSSEDADDLERRLVCQQAGWFSFFGAQCVRTGLSHALGRRIGAHFDVPHGYTSALILPHVMRMQVEQVPDRLRLVAEAVGVDSPNLTDRQAAERAVQAVAELVLRLKLPSHLQEVGIQEADLSWIAEGRPEVVELLRAAL